MARQRQKWVSSLLMPAESGQGHPDESTLPAGHGGRRTAQPGNAFSAGAHTQVDRALRTPGRAG